MHDRKKDCRCRSLRSSAVRLQPEALVPFPRDVATVPAGCHSSQVQSQPSVEWRKAAWAKRLAADCPAGGRLILIVDGYGPEESRRQCLRSNEEGLLVMRLHARACLLYVSTVKRIVKTKTY